MKILMKFLRGLGLPNELIIRVNNKEKSAVGDYNKDTLDSLDLAVIVHYFEYNITIV